MVIEIRPCRDRDELASYGEVVSYVFAVNEAEDLQRELDSVDPSWTTCAFDDGRVVSSLGTIPFTVQLNGRAVPMGGLTGAGTLPEYRRQGLLRKTMTRALERMHEEGQPFGILWASMGAIYQRFGFGLASPLVSYRFDPRQVELLPGYESSGRCRLTPPDEALEVIRPVYEQYIAPRNLPVHRTEHLWNAQTLRKKKGRQPYIAVYRNADGEARGFVAYRTSEDDNPDIPGPNQDMEIVDLAWLDLDAYVGIWQYLRSHDLVREVHQHGLVPDDDPIQEMLLEPRMLNKRVNDAIWMRVVDVERGLAARAYNGSGRLRIAVQDHLLDWNARTWELTVEEGEPTVKAATGAPDLAMPVATLATLISGRRNASELLRARKLEAHTAASVRIADGLFATEYAPFLPNEF